MIEEETDGVKGGNLEDGPLREDISHWVSALDRWVKLVDLGLGRRERHPQQTDSDGFGVDGSPTQIDDRFERPKGEGVEG